MISSIQLSYNACAIVAQLYEIQNAYFRLDALTRTRG